MIHFCCVKGNGYEIDNVWNDKKENNPHKLSRSVVLLMRSSSSDSEYSELFRACSRGR